MLSKTSRSLHEVKIITGTLARSRTACIIAMHAVVAASPRQLRFQHEYIRHLFAQPINTLQSIGDRDDFKALP